MREFISKGATIPVRELPGRYLYVGVAPRKYKTPVSTEIQQNFKNTFGNRGKKMVESFAIKEKFSSDKQREGQSTER